MEKQIITGWNACPGAPKNWDATKYGPCGGLPIRVHPPASLENTTVPVEWCESAWKPSAQELEWLVKGGNLILRVHGWQPAVALYVEPPALEPLKDPLKGEPT